MTIHSFRPRRRPGPARDLGSEAATETIPASQHPDTGPLPRYQPQLDQYGRPPRHYRHPDAAMFALTRDSGWVLLCGLNPQQQHADHAANHDFYVFDALRRSAWNSSWRIDYAGRWICPRCQMTPAFITLAPVTVYSELAARARLGQDPHGEFWYRVAAEESLREDVAGAVSETRGRHHASTPEGPQQ